ncbi:hypothetical protein [Micromonospora sp. NBC_00421]|uniref:hypothetical protein n=1 Tax=Micromonospora sp. NBC_00421 TaxID=2975976 RepID=UPI002E1EC3BF
MGDHYGDQINMHGGYLQIGKIVGRDAADELSSLISLLQQKGAADAQGNVVDPVVAAETVRQEKSRLTGLHEAVRKGLGPAMKTLATGTAVEFIVQSLT